MQLSHPSPFRVQGVLLALSHQMYRWLSNMWETAFLRKNTSQHDPFVSNPNVSFVQDLITISIIVVSLLISDVL